MTMGQAKLRELWWDIKFVAPMRSVVELLCLSSEKISLQGEKGTISNLWPLLEGAAPEGMDISCPANTLRWPADRPRRIRQVKGKRKTLLTQE